MKDFIATLFRVYHYLTSHFDMFGLNFFSNFRCPLAAQDEGCNIGLARIWRYLSLHKQHHYCICVTFPFIPSIWINISNKLLLGHTRIVGIVDWGDLANPWETAYIANLQKNLQGINNRIHSYKCLGQCNKMMMNDVLFTIIEISVHRGRSHERRRRKRYAT